MLDTIAVAVSESSSTTIKVARSRKKRSYASMDSVDTVDSPRANLSRLKASSVSATVIAGLGTVFDSKLVASGLAWRLMPLMLLLLIFPPQHHIKAARNESETKAIGAKTIAFQK